MAGYFALMLHSHIPYCKKSGVWPAGEEWLFEAMNETYIPLLQTLRRFNMEGVKPRLTIGVVPVLMEQLADDYMKGRFHEYMEDKIARAERDIDRFSGDPQLRAVAEYWRDLFRDRLKSHDEHFFGDVLGTLKYFQEQGLIEVVTSAATHGFLPLMEADSSIFAQARVGVETYRKYFDRDPKGFWLPECAYRPAQWSNREHAWRPAVDKWLAEEGIAYFFVESSTLTRSEFVDNLHSEQAPSTYRGYRLESGVAVFGRNEDTGRQVWSPEQGYPGDPSYLEFHKKDPESGLHYWKVTGGPNKEVYDVEAAHRSVEAHAEHFVSLLAERLSRQTSDSNPHPIVMSPYDCELFGHWWHEGVAWLERVYRLLDDSATVDRITVGDYADRYSDGFSTVRMGPGTWGLNGDFTVWENPDHGWIWPLINGAAGELEKVLNHIPEDNSAVDTRARKILGRLCAELLLMQGSDWPFLLFTEQAKEYANQRFHHHHQRFLKLLWAAKDLSDPQRMPDHELARIEDVDSVWPELDFNLFRRRVC